MVGRVALGGVSNGNSAALGFGGNFLDGTMRTGRAWTSSDDNWLLARLGGTLCLYVMVSARRFCHHWVELTKTSSTMKGKPSSGPRRQVSRTLLFFSADDCLGDDIMVQCELAMKLFSEAKLATCAKYRQTRLGPRFTGVVDNFTVANSVCYDASARAISCANTCLGTEGFQYV